MKPEKRFGRDAVLKVMYTRIGVPYIAPTFIGFSHRHELPKCNQPERAPLGHVR